MDPREKGSRREREARDIYENAGYKVEKSVSQRYDRTDWYNHFDLMATRRDDFRLCQVKSNRASDVQTILDWANQYLPAWVTVDVLVCHDRDGWRLLRLLPRADRYVTVVDEREEECRMSERVTSYLRVNTE